MLIRPGAIGDCILALPALEFLKTDYTEVWISSPAVPLVQFADQVRSIASTGLDRVIDDVPHDLVETLSGFDEIVSWYGANRTEFRDALSAVHPSCTFLPALPSATWLEHAGDFFLQQVGGPKGPLPSIQIPVSAQRRSVVIHPFSGSASKNWPLASFQELATRLPAVEWAQTGFDNLLELAHWMSGAAVYLGNDSGISHLAAAIGMPGVVLFGPSKSSVWAPRGKQVRILQHVPLDDLSADEVQQYLTPYLAG